MSFDLFGYNGVFALDQSLVNKLLGTYLYDRYLVEIGGQLTDGDFISVSVPIATGTVQIYLELARPFLHVETSDGSNLVTLHVPFSAAGAFLTQNGQIVVLAVPLLAIVLFDCPVQKTDSGLSIDFSKLTGDTVGIEAIGARQGPTGVGGVEISQTPLLDDNTITKELEDKNHNTTITGKDLRNKLADFLRKGAIGPTSVPLSLGGAQAAIGSWDLLLFGDANDRDPNDSPGEAGADLLLFAADGSGQGVRTDATQTLPPAPEDPPFTWAMEVRESALQDDINRALDGGPYYVQGGTLNSADNPLGFLVVPAVGSRAGALPTGAGMITVGAPQNGQAKVTIASGGLTPNGRARLRNLDRNLEVAFPADGNGAASLSIRADAGERLGLAIDAVSLPSHSSVIIGRPRLQFGEGQLWAKFHYHVIIPYWCDLDGDATVAFALFADRTKPFSVGVRVLDANASVPWWVYVAVWLGPGVIGQDIFAPILLALVPTIVHAIAGDLIGGDVSSFASTLTDQVSAPSPDNVALLLDQVDVHETGIQLSGRADSSMFLAYGRMAAFSTQGGLTISASTPSSVYMRFDWKPDIASIDISCAARAAVINADARVTFWNATYDDLPDDSKFQRNPFTMSAGDVVMVWVEIQGGHAKVLFERAADGGDAPSTGIVVTWIAYRDRVGRSIKLVNHLKATLVGETSSMLLDVKWYKYDGTISLTRKKFFLSDETQALGEEQWFWDDQPVTEQQGITMPGGTVLLDAANRQLVVHIDQTGLVGAGEDIPGTHWVKFHGTDVFGNTLDTKLLVQTPPRTLSSKPIAALNPPWINPLGPDPGPDQRVLEATQLASILTDMFAGQVSTAEAASIARSVSEALTTGTGRLDGFGALGLLSLLGGGRIV